MRSSWQEEGAERDYMTVTLAGDPNMGKSSIINSIFGLPHAFLAASFWEPLVNKQGGDYYGHGKFD